MPYKLKENDHAFLLGDLNCNALFENYPTEQMLKLFEKDIFKVLKEEEKNYGEYSILNAILKHSKMFTY